jgi:hypothetical protein
MLEVEDRDAEASHVVPLRDDERSSTHPCRLPQIGFHSLASNAVARRSTGSQHQAVVAVDLDVG